MMAVCLRAPRSLLPAPRFGREWTAAADAGGIGRPRGRIGQPIAATVRRHPAPDRWRVQAAMPDGNSEDAKGTKTGRFPSSCLPAF